MRFLKGFNWYLLLAIIVISGIVNFSFPVFGYLWTGQIIIQNPSATPYTYPHLRTGMNNSQMIADGYANSTMLDVLIKATNGTALPMLPTATNGTWFTAPYIGASSYYTFLWTSGNSPDKTRHQLVVGNGGYVTTPDDAEIELGEIFDYIIDTYVQRPTGADAYFMNKPGSYNMTVDSAGNVTFSVDTTNPEFGPIAYDGTNWYFSAYKSIVKVDEATWTEQDRFVDFGIENYIQDMAYDAGFLYILSFDVATSNAEILKIDVTTMESVDQFGISETEATQISILGTELYFSVEVTGDAYLYDLDLATLSTQATFPTSDLPYPGGVTNDGVNLYFAAGNDTNIVYYKIDPGTMGSTDDYTYTRTTPYQNNPGQMIVDSGFLYAPTVDNPEEVLKIIAGNMTLSTSWTAAYNGIAYSKPDTDSTYLYVPMTDDDAGNYKVAKVLVSDMSLNATWTNSEDADEYLDVQDGSILVSSDRIDWVTASTMASNTSNTWEEKIVTLEAPAVADGEHVFEIYKNSLTLVNLAVDTVDIDNESYIAGWVEDTADDITFVSNSFPYTEYITLNVAGSNVLQYEIVDVIEGQNLPDTDTGGATANNGTITWGNPDLNSTGMDSFGPATTPTPVTTSSWNITTTAATGFLPTPTPTSDFRVTPTPRDFPGRDIIDDIADAGSTPRQVPWMLITGFIILVASLTTSWAMRRFGSGNLWGKLGVIIGLMGVFVGLRVYDFWMILIFALIAVAIAMGSRQPTWN